MLYGIEVDVSKMQCKSDHPKKYEGTEFHICGKSEGGSICHGDSGGPMICEENGMAVLYGISSYYMATVVDNSCHADSTNYYTDVYNSLEFINHIIGYSLVRFLTSM